MQGTPCFIIIQYQPARPQRLDREPTLSNKFDVGKGKPLDPFSKVHKIFTIIYCFRKFSVIKFIIEGTQEKARWCKSSQVFNFFIK